MVSSRWRINIGISCCRPLITNKGICCAARIWLHAAHALRDILRRHVLRARIAHVFAVSRQHELIIGHLLSTVNERGYHRAFYLRE